MKEYVEWVSQKTGHTLQFQVCNRNDGWSNLGGIYMFCKLAGNTYIPLYIGQTGDFNNRLPNHEKLDSAIKNGATHILAAVEHSKRIRDIVEQLLIQQFQPILNEQLK